MTRRVLNFVSRRPRPFSDLEIQALAREAEADRELREEEERERRAEEASGFGAAVAFFLAVYLVLAIFGE